MHELVKDRAKLFAEPIEATDELRNQQIRELDAYVRGVMAAAPAGFVPAYGSVAAYEKSVAGVRERFAGAIGYPPPAAGGRPGKLAVEATRLGEDGLARYERLSIEVLPGVHTVGLYLTPRQGAAGRRPLVISQHGGAGCPEIAAFRRDNYNDMIPGAVAEGYNVFAPTHLHISTEFPERPREVMDQRLRQVGTTITAVEIFKIVRAIDALIERPEVDPERVGMIGLSYGGQYTLLTSALEKRIKAAVVACYCIDQGVNLTDPMKNLDRHWMGSLTGLKNADLAALVCPRALQIQHGTGDDIIPIAVSREIDAGVRGHYAALGLAERYEYREFEGWHEFSGELAWPFLRKWL